MKQHQAIAVALALLVTPAAAENSIYKWSKLSFTTATPFDSIGAGLPERTRIGLINREVNSFVHRKDEAGDRWQDPEETLKLRSGDCEDIAILKIQALLNAGFAKERLSLLVVNGNHAVVRVDGLILDNRTNVLNSNPGAVTGTFRVP